MSCLSVSCVWSFFFFFFALAFLYHTPATNMYHASCDGSIGQGSAVHALFYSVSPTVTCNISICSGASASIKTSIQFFDTCKHSKTLIYSTVHLLYLLGILPSLELVLLMFVFQIYIVYIIEVEASTKPSGVLDSPCTAYWVVFLMFCIFGLRKTN